MASLRKDLVMLILQFLREENFKEAAHSLEQESGFYFDMKYFEEKVLAGEWVEAEKYLSGFAKVEDNPYSMKIYFELRIQKYLEALDRKDTPEVINILVNDLKVFSNNNDLYREITQLLTLENFRENEKLSDYGDIQEIRGEVMVKLKEIIEANPLLADKLDFPVLRSSRLKNMVNNQSSNLQPQHPLGRNQRPYSCGSSDGGFAAPPVSFPSAGSAIPGPHGVNAPFPFPAANPNALASWVSDADVASSSSVQPAIPNQVAGMKRPDTPAVTPGTFEYHSAEQLLRRLKAAQPAEEVSYPPVRNQPPWAQDTFPKKVILIIKQGKPVRSMDFHPFLHTLLLVGYSNGDIALFELKTGVKLLYRPFQIWNVAACSAAFQASKDGPICVNHITWSPHGDFFGAAFDKNLIHVYVYAGANDLSQHLEIDAHVGGVNDLVLTPVDQQLCVVTCGDDKLIKVWDMKGQQLYNFAGHDAPVYSICPHVKDNVQYILSTSTDGKIKVWLYDNKGSRADYDAPGRWCTKLFYSADGTRLFSCGTSKDGKSFLDEWDDGEGTIKRSYSGFGQKSSAGGVVQFDASQDLYLAAGEDNQIKFWHKNRNVLLTSIDADGELPNFPCLKFNKAGTLLAVTAIDNGIKILANEVGERSLPVGPPATLVKVISCVSSCCSSTSAGSVKVVEPSEASTSTSNPTAEEEQK